MAYATPDSLIWLPWFFFVTKLLLYLCVAANDENLSEYICHILVVFLNSIFNFLAVAILKFINGILFSSM